MDLQWLLTFEKILETGSFAKAAEELGYTQPSVTFQIKQLEKELSIQLFDKIGRTRKLSEAGKAVVPLIHETIDSMTRLKIASQNTDTMMGDLKVAFADSIIRFTNLTQAITQFLQDACNVNLSISRKPCSDVVDALKSGDIDIGMMYQVSGLEDPMLEITNLREVPMALISSGHQDRQWDTKTQTINGKHPYFITDPRCAFHGVYKRYLRENKIEASHDTVLGDWNTVLEGIKNGQGISLVPYELVEEEIKFGILHQIPMSNLHETVYIALATHKNKPMSTLTKYFIELVLERF